MAAGTYDTGWQRFTIGETEGDAGNSIDWTNPGNISSLDGVASAAFPAGTGNGDTSESLILRGWWDSNDVPGDAVIKTAEIRLDIRGTGATLYKFAVDTLQWDNGAHAGSLPNDPGSYTPDGNWANQFSLVNWDFDSDPGALQYVDQIAPGDNSDGMAFRLRLDDTLPSPFELVDPITFEVRNIECRFTYDSVVGPGGDTGAPFALLLGAF